MFIYQLKCEGSNFKNHSQFKAKKGQNQFILYRGWGLSGQFLPKKRKHRNLS